MLLLAIDTAANLCSACVWDTAAGERGRCVLDVGKGHAEVLMGVIDEALAQAGIAFAQLDAIGVSIGPGSFTGVRIGVATARGLALALNVPAVGVSTLEALALEARDALPGRKVLSAIDAGRGKVYASRHAVDGSALSAPAEHDFAYVVELAAAGGFVLAGSAAAALVLAAQRPVDVAGHGRSADIAAFARIAAARAGDASTASTRPKPLYLRGADAKPQVNFALPRKDTA